MSRQQREKIDAMLRQPRPGGPPPSVEELRAVILDITADVPHVFQSFAGGPWTKPTRHWTVRRCPSASTSPPARRPRRRRPTDRRFPNRHRTGLNRRTSSGHHP